MNNNLRTNRLTLDKRFREGTELYSITAYIEANPDLSSGFTNEVMAFIKYRYLHLSLKRTDSQQARKEALKAIYFFERLIQEIIIDWGLDDPRHQLLLSLAPKIAAPSLVGIPQHIDYADQVDASITGDSEYFDGSNEPLDDDYDDIDAESAAALSRLC